jgi:hypothetical protein
VVLLQQALATGRWEGVCTTAINLQVDSVAAAVDWVCSCTHLNYVVVSGAHPTSWLHTTQPSEIRMPRTGGTASHEDAQHPYAGCQVLGNPNHKTVTPQPLYHTTQSAKRVTHSMRRTWPQPWCSALARLLYQTWATLGSDGALQQQQQQHIHVSLVSAVTYLMLTTHERCRTLQTRRDAQHTP